MSAEHVAWVFRHSPAKDKAFGVHVAIADSVNDQHDHEFWMKLGKLAVKARCSRRTAQQGVAWLVEHGLLLNVEGVDPARASQPVRYRFLFPDLPIVYDTRSATAAHRVGNPRAPGAQPLRTKVGKGCAPKEPKGEPNQEPKVKVPPGGATPPDLVDTLCDMLADAIWRHRGESGRPTISAAWRRDMRLLVERGPLGVSDPEALDEGKIISAIKTVFTNLADPDGGGFCWADQVQSPGALRRHWLKMRQAWRQRQNGQRTGKGGAAIDRAAQRLGAGEGEPLFPKELTP